MTGALAAILQRDIRLALRQGGGAALGLVFFLLIVTMTPLAIGPDPALLARIGPAMLWLAAVLSILLGLDRLFLADLEDGALQQMRLSSAPLEFIVLAKAIAHWLVTGLPLVIAAPAYGLLLALSPAAMLAVTVTLLVGSPALVFIGATSDAVFRAFDATTGELVWQEQLDYTTNTIPVSYQGKDGRQYIAVLATGGTARGTPRNEAGAPANDESLIVWALPRTEGQGRDRR